MQRILGGVARAPSPRCAVLPASLPSTEAAHSAGLSSAIAGRSDEHPVRRGSRFSDRGTSGVLNSKGSGTFGRGQVAGLSNRVAALGQDADSDAVGSARSCAGSVSKHTPYKGRSATRVYSIPDEADEVLDWECTRTPSRSSGKIGHGHGGTKNRSGCAGMESNTCVSAGNLRSWGRDSPKGKGRFDLQRGAYNNDVRAGGNNSSTSGYRGNNHNSAKESLQGRSDNISLGGVGRGSSVSPSRGGGSGRSDRGCEEDPLGRRFSSNSIAIGRKRDEQHSGDEEFPLDGASASGLSSSQGCEHVNTGSGRGTATSRFVDRDAGASSCEGYITNSVNGKGMRGHGKGHGQGAQSLEYLLDRRHLPTSIQQVGGKDGQSGKITEEERQRKHIALNRMILDCTDAWEILDLCDARIDEFNHVNIVTAFHRIAKHEKARGAYQ